MQIVLLVTPTFMSGATSTQVIWALATKNNPFWLKPRVWCSIYPTT